MADSKRGGRSNSDDDEFDENDILDELDDSDDDADLADDDADDAESTDKRRDRSPAMATRSGKSTGSKTAARTKDREAGGPGLIGRIVKFIREVVAELQKVIYPTRKELLTYTSVVLVFVVVVMTIVSLLDVGFASLIGIVFGDQTST